MWDITVARNVTNYKFCCVLRKKLILDSIIVLHCCNATCFRTEVGQLSEGSRDKSYCCQHIINVMCYTVPY